MRPRLLVSIRNSDEAAAALAGGADIVDVKEPANGSLGKASDKVIQQVVDDVRRLAPRIPVSAALGEVSDWTAFPETMDDQNPFPIGLTYLKMGLSDSVDRPVPWRNALQKARLAVEAVHGGNRFPDWAAVAYVDHIRCGAPSVMDVLDEAHAAGCSVLLLDTFSKDTTTLFDWLTDDELAQTRERSTACGLQLALAGRIDADHLSDAVRFGPDILAVRGAACHGNDREATISEQRVRDLRSAISSLSSILFQ